MAAPTLLEKKAHLLVRVATELHLLGRNTPSLLTWLETSRAAAVDAEAAVLYFVMATTPCDCRAAELHSPAHASDCDTILARRRWQERPTPASDKTSRAEPPPEPSRAEPPAAGGYAATSAPPCDCGAIELGAEHRHPTTWAVTHWMESQ